MKNGYSSLDCSIVEGLIVIRFMLYQVGVEKARVIAQRKLKIVGNDGI
jgi:hypothetical protein